MNNQEINEIDDPEMETYQGFTASSSLEDYQNTTAQIDEEIKAERNKEFNKEPEAWQGFLRLNQDLYKEFIEASGLEDEFRSFVKKCYEESK